ncbi:hypothetical protein [Rhodoferax sp.]|jgi:hypothetical protein|uniref:hypothetical protein n=1 Tax=Rhodoferax sp. TaxID=50421 RepID=UPI003783166B
MSTDTLIVNPHPDPVLAQQSAQFPNFAAFLAWVSHHWHDPQVLQHAQWLISPFVAMAQRNPKSAEAWRTAAWRVPESYGTLSSPEQPPLTLRWLDASGAKRLLSETDPESELQLSGLTELDADTAQVISAHKGALDLSGLRQLTRAVVTALEAHTGLIRLDALQNLGGSLVPLVRRRTTPRGSTQPGLSLGGLTRINAHDAYLLAQVQGDLLLNGLKEINTEQATWLTQRQGDGDKKLGTLHLDGWQHPSPAALQALAAYRGSLSLGAWFPPKEGAPDHWKALASEARDGLSLGAIASLTEANAQALAKLQLKRLYLPGVTSLDTTLVEHLGSMVLLALVLDNVEHATAQQIRRLVQLQHKDSSTSGLSMARLVLTPEVRAELTRHKKLLDPLYERVYEER